MPSVTQAQAGQDDALKDGADGDEDAAALVWEDRSGDAAAFAQPNASPSGEHGGKADEKEEPGSWSGFEAREDGGAEEGSGKEEGSAEEEGREESSEEEEDRGASDGTAARAALGGAQLAGATEGELPPLSASGAESAGPDLCVVGMLLCYVGLVKVYMWSSEMLAQVQARSPLAREERGRTAEVRGARLPRSRRPADSLFGRTPTIAARPSTWRAATVCANCAALRTKPCLQVLIKLLLSCELGYTAPARFCRKAGAKTQLRNDITNFDKRCCACAHLG